MGVKVTRQRYYDDNQLAVEICVGTKHIGKDVLPTRYKDLGESKYLVSPVDAFKASVKVLNKWHIDYQDELKKIALVNYDNSGGKKYFDPHSKSDMSKLEKWANEKLNAMSKCGHCQKIIGTTSAIYESDDMPNRVYCTEVCLATAYRDVFQKELPATAAKKKK